MTAPRILTVAEVDAIAEAGAAWCGEETFASMARTARAMAVADSSRMPISTSDCSCHGASFVAYAMSGGPCAASIVEAIEAATDWDESAMAAEGDGNADHA